MVDCIVELRQKLVLWLFAFLECYFLTLIVFFFVQGLAILSVLVFILAFYIGVWSVLMIYTSLAELSKAGGVFLSLTALFAMIFTLLLYHTNTPVVLWLLVIPFGTLVYFGSLAGFKIGIACVSMYILLLFVPPFLIRNGEDFFQLTDFQVYFIDACTVFTCGCTFAFLFFSAWRLEKEKKSEKVEIIKSTEKFDTLYSEIIDLFSREKIYTKPDFSMAELADRLDSNKTYIYRALKQNGIEDNFATFVNKYRIKEFKDKVLNDVNEKYTISYLYESCGFKFQSSFNKIFKDLEGLTPSEYMLVQKSRAALNGSPRARHH